MPDQVNQLLASFMRWAAQRGARGKPAPVFTVQRVDYQALPTGQDSGQAAAEVDVSP